MSAPVEQNTPKIAPVEDEVLGDDIDKAFDRAVFHRSCYLAGPMSGYENFNFPAFEKAAADLRSRGWRVFSPHETGWGDGDPTTGSTDEKEYREFMAEDLRQVCLADAVICLPNWEDSRGANLEVSVARRLDLPVLAYGDELTEIPVAAPPVLLDGKAIDEYVEELHGTPDEPESVCAEADRLVSTDRAEVYGHPLDDFTKVVEAAKALGINPLDGPEWHALYWIIAKLARLQNSPGHHDSIVDICGYAKTYDMVLKERERRAAGDE